MDPFVVATNERWDKAGSRVSTEMNLHGWMNHCRRWKEVTEAGRCFFLSLFSCGTVTLLLCGWHLKGKTTSLVPHARVIWQERRGRLYRQTHMQGAFFKITSNREPSCRPNNNMALKQYHMRNSVISQLIKMHNAKQCPAMSLCLNLESSVRCYWPGTITVDTLCMPFFFLNLVRDCYCQSSQHWGGNLTILCCPRNEQFWSNVRFPSPQWGKPLTDAWRRTLRS